MSRNKNDRYISSLLSKPFIILSGTSGTGKTRLALKFANYLEQSINKNALIATMKIDKTGKIIDKKENEVKKLCRLGNKFITKINDTEGVYKSKIIFCEYVDNTEWDLEGLGKDKIDISISREYKSYELVPVGADWTDVRPLIGYKNPFGSNGEEVYEITDTLKVILRALHPENKYKPHFLILDEMNLSHVERYFSIFLSAMEASKSSSDPINLISIDNLEIIKKSLGKSDDLKVERDSIDNLIKTNTPIYMPNNLHIVGTINVDETTYMFSPKVLDRAHVIEMNTDEPSKILKSLKANTNDAIDIKNTDGLFNLFKESIDNRYNQSKDIMKDLEDILEATKIKKVEVIISSIYKLLKPCKFDFGYRTIIEILEYIAYGVKLDETSDSYESILDEAVLQKILPKIHGNKREIEDCLNSLSSFCLGKEASYTHGGEEVKVNSTNIELPMSKYKINQMLLGLSNVGYTSFI
ncbi:MAG: hypothetical protein E6538_08565 [Paeniclostridium sordellii]|nr:hypothetical protein [Paeniclostridium sordellii]